MDEHSFQTDFYIFNDLPSSWQSMLPTTCKKEAFDSGLGMESFISGEVFDEDLLKIRGRTVSTS